MVKVNKNSFKKNTNEQTIKRSFRMKQVINNGYDAFSKQGYGSNSLRVEPRYDKSYICTKCPDIYDYITLLMRWKGKTDTSCSATLGKYDIEVTYQPELEDKYFYPDDEFVLKDVKATYTVGDLVEYVCNKYPDQR